MNGMTLIRSEYTFMLVCTETVPFENEHKHTNLMILCETHCENFYAFYARVEVYVPC